MFGSDSTGGGVGFQFRQIKADAKRQKDCVKSGGDPKTLGIGSKGEAAGTFQTCLSFSWHCKAQKYRIWKIIGMNLAIASYYPDGTVAPFQHRFRYILKEGHRPRCEINRSAVSISYLLCAYFTLARTSCI